MVEVEKKTTPNTGSITDQIKDNRIARYWEERVAIRVPVWDLIQPNSTILELYAGMGMMTQVYKDSGKFKRIITSDIDKTCTAQYKLSAMDFINENLPKLLRLGVKLDVIDYESYGGPHWELQRTFEIIQNKMCPIIIMTADGLGLGMKRSNKGMRVKERFMLNDDDPIDLRHCWKQHTEMTRLLHTRLAQKYGMKVTELANMQAKGGNFVFSSWLYEKV